MFTTTDGSAFTGDQAQGSNASSESSTSSRGVKGTVDGFTAEDQLRAQRQQVDDGAAQIAEARAQLSDAQRQIDAWRAQSGGDPAAAAMIADQQDVLDTSIAELTHQQSQLHREREGAEPVTGSTRVDGVRSDVE